MNEGLGPLEWDIVLGVVNLIAIVVLTAWVVPRVSRKDAKKAQQEDVLFRMLKTWLIPANPEYQATIATIPIVFADQETVVRQHNRYIAFVSSEENKAKTRFLQLAQEHQIALIAEMGKVIGLDLDAKQLGRSAYLSKGYVGREVMLENALGAWPRIADALEKGNENSRQILDEIRNGNSDQS